MKSQLASTPRLVTLPVLLAAMLAASALSGAGRMLAVASTTTPLQPAVVFVSTRDNPSGTLADASEIYLMDADHSNVRRLTNDHYGDQMPAISPDGTRIVFDSNRLRREGQPANTQHLFLMQADGSAQTPLTWGSSATWSPDGKSIAFHASAGGGAPPIRVEPGAPAPDSDIFVGQRNRPATRTFPLSARVSPCRSAGSRPDGRRDARCSRSSR
jgi:Tol biopolymer transport system component